MKRSGFIMSCGLFVSILFMAAGSSFAEDNEAVSPLNISFEPDEGFEVNKSILHQKGWSIFAAHKHRAEIRFRGDSGYLPTTGESMLMAVKGTPIAHCVLPYQPGQDLYFSAETAVGSTENGTVSRFYLSSAEEGRRFHGASFGLESTGEELQVFVRDGDEKSHLSTDQKIEPQVFYRFECLLKPEDGTYDLKVFHGDKLLGELSDLKLRKGLKKIDYLMLQGTEDTCFDDLKISWGTPVNQTDAEAPR